MVRVKRPKGNHKHCIHCGCDDVHVFLIVNEELKVTLVEKYCKQCFFEIINQK